MLRLSKWELSTVLVRTLEQVRTPAACWASCAGTTVITDCYTADCNVMAKSTDGETGDAVGGIVSSGNATVMYCYSTSTIEGKTNVGGIVGANDGGAVISVCL